MFRYLIISLLLFSSSSFAFSTQNIHSMVVFGDSLSDAGYMDRFPRPPGKVPRFTNGLVWAQYLSADLLHQTLSANNLNPIISGKTAYANGKLNNNDYAAGGATSYGRGISHWPKYYLAPPATRQITQYLLQHAHHGKINANNLYIIWIGSNDLLRVYIQYPKNKLRFFAALFPAATRADEVIAQQVTRLHQYGAKHIIVINLPDQGLTPLLNQSWLMRTFYYYLIKYMNYRLQSDLDTKKLGFYVKIIQINPIFLSIIHNPEHTITEAGKTFHFTNVTEEGCNKLSNGKLPIAISCIVPPQHRHYLFSDDVHPTTYAHQLIALVLNKQILADNQL